MRAAHKRRLALAEAKEKERQNRQMVEAQKSKFVAGRKNRGKVGKTKVLITHHSNTVYLVQVMGSINVR